MRTTTGEQLAPMVVIGIVGGVASGKSLVSRQLEAMGAVGLDADAAGHAVLEEAEIRNAVRKRWGDSVFGEDGRVDRGALARIVFGDSPQSAEHLEHLERLTHPRIEQRLRCRISELVQAGTPAAVLDAAVMMKAGWDRFCDRIVFVDAPLELRRARAAARGWTAAQFQAREASQHSLAWKRRRADWVIDNSRSPQETQRQIARWWSRLKAVEASGESPAPDSPQTGSPQADVPGGDPSI